MSVLVIVKDHAEQRAIYSLGWDAIVWNGDAAVGRDKDIVVVPATKGSDLFAKRVARTVEDHALSVAVVDLNFWANILQPDDEQRLGLLENALTFKEWEAKQERAEARSGSRTSTDDDGSDAAPIGMTGHLARQSLSAHIFVERMGDKVRFEHPAKRWLIWGGHRWKPDRDGRIKDLWLKVLARRFEKALLNNDKDAMQATQTAGASKTAIVGGLDIAASMEPVRNDGGGWDPDPYLLGCENGLVDLRTGLLRDGKPSDLVTRSTRLDYDPEAKAPRWERFLEEVFDGDADLIEWFQRLAGASLVGNNDAEVLPIYIGGGNNGKTVALNVMAQVMGDYSVPISIETLTHAKHESGRASPDIMRLRGARFATTTEPKANARLDGATVKKLASRDWMSARALYGQQVEWQPTHTLHVATNEMPHVDDMTHGFWRRVALIPWSVRFIRAGEAGDGPREDPRLEESLRSTEAAGILVWAVQGAQRYLAAEGGLQPLPEAVRVRTQEYRHEEDTLGVWFTERIGPTVSKAPQQVKYFHVHYVAWCDESGVPDEERLRIHAFGREFRKRVEALPFKVGRKQMSRNKAWAYIGLKVIEPERPKTDPEGVAKPDDSNGGVAEGGTETTLRTHP